MAGMFGHAESSGAAANRAFKAQLNKVYGWYTGGFIAFIVVLAVLDSHGIAGFRITGNPQAILPMSVSPLGEVRIAVHEDVADDARRIIASHRGRSA